MFGDTVWRQLRGTGRQDRTNQYYQSADARRLNDAVGGALSEESTLAYDLGFDFGQMFQFKTHSCGIVTVRCADLPHIDRNKRRFNHILVIIPGPSEPKNTAPYFAELLDEFAAHAPGRDPIKVRVPDPAGPAGSTVVVSHSVVLSGVYADTPARAQMSKFMGHGAIMGCGWCTLRGASQPRGGVYFCGYDAPTTYGYLHRNQRGKMCHAGDEVSLLTHEDQVMVSWL